MAVLKEYYNILHDWEGTQYLGLTLNWVYENKVVLVAIPEYVEKALQYFHHLWSNKPQDQPYPQLSPNYGAKQQYAEQDDTLPMLSKKDTSFVQEVVGTFLYYAHAVNCTTLTALGSITTQQPNLTKNTMEKVEQLLDYAATHPDAIITYQVSDIVLAAHINASYSYFSESNAQSQAGGQFFMSSNHPYPPTTETY